VPNNLTKLNLKLPHLLLIEDTITKKKLTSIRADIRKNKNKLKSMVSDRVNYKNFKILLEEKKINQETLKIMCLVIDDEQVKLDCILKQLHAKYRSDISDIRFKNLDKLDEEKNKMKILLDKYDGLLTRKKSEQEELDFIIEVEKRNKDTLSNVRIQARKIMDTQDDIDSLKEKITEELWLLDIFEKKSDNIAARKKSYLKARRKEFIKKKNKYKEDKIAF